MHELAGTTRNKPGSREREAGGRTGKNIKASLGTQPKSASPPSPFTPQPTYPGRSAVVPGISRPEHRVPAMASSGDAQGFAMAGGRGSGGFNGIWETEKPRVCGVEVYEQEAAHLAALCLPCAGSKGNVVPRSGHIPLCGCQCLAEVYGSWVPPRGRWGLSIARGPSGTGRAPRAPRAPRSDSTGTWGASALLPGGSPPPPPTGMGRVSPGKGDRRVPSASLYPIKRSLRLRSSQLPLISCFSATPRTEVLWDVPKDMKHPCKPQAGRQPHRPCRDGGHGRGSTGPSPLPATLVVFCREM